MKNTEYDALEPSHARANGHEPDSSEVQDIIDKQSEGVVATVATIGVVGVGVAVVEFAFLPVFALGAVAALAPKLMPQIGSAVKPMLKSTVRGAYKISQKTKEFMAETHEHVKDIVAEVDSEVEQNGAVAPESAHSAAKAAE